MKIVIAVDSFKGSLSSLEAGIIIEKGIRKIIPEALMEVISVADGGEGSLDMIRDGMDKHFVKVSDPLGREINTWFLSEGTTAYLEMAQSSGLTLLDPAERNPITTNTFGLGQQISEALRLSLEKIVIFAGGSATNDAGLGALSALGFTFYDQKDVVFHPVGGSLKDIIRFEAPKKPIQAEFIVATDVDNPFYGPSGAVYVYADQKGAEPDSLPILEAGIKNIASLFPDKNIQAVPGAGAAGGLAGGLHLFLDAKVMSASDILFDKIKLEDKINQSDVVITGEGRIDSQSMSGKLISRILDFDAPTILIAGEITEPVKRENVLLQTALKSPGMSTEESMTEAKDLLMEKAKEIAAFIQSKLV